jgi:hypothetical protein
VKTDADPRGDAISETGDRRLVEVEAGRSERLKAADRQIDPKPQGALDRDFPIAELGVVENARLFVLFEA